MNESISQTSLVNFSNYNASYYSKRNNNQQMLNSRQSYRSKLDKHKNSITDLSKENP